VLSDVNDIDAGAVHVLALKTDGTLWAWGANFIGQLGDGTLVNRTTPIQITAITDVVGISAGYYSSSVLKSDGTVWGWGRNHQGQLGNGTNIGGLVDDYVRVPTQMIINNVVSIESSKYYRIMTKNDGTLWSCGVGALGDGVPLASAKIVNTPVRVINLGSVMQVETGLFQAIAIRSDGTVWTWGENNYGQLGDNTTIHRTAPVQINFTDAIAVNAGQGHTMAVKSDGTVWTWGWNNYGQLGDGTTYDKYIPTQVPNFNLFQ
jgi:alpha-tubulin suppressor-like RCC1 family protein